MIKILRGHGPSWQVCAYRAGHVLGAAMFSVEIGGMNALYTGDYSRLADRHLSAADLPDTRPDIGRQLREAWIEYLRRG